jgi:hypothetical protein
MAEPLVRSRFGDDFRDDFRDDRLARRYRRLLFAYPPSYRSARGDEYVATLLDLAPPGRRWPRPGDAADLVAAGLRCRWRTGSVVGLDGGLGLAAPVALALAAGIALFAWWRVEPVGSNVDTGSALFGTFRTLGPVAFAAWLVAAMGWATVSRAAVRVLIGVALVVTVCLPLAAAVSGVDRPPLWVVSALTAFGLLSLSGAPPDALDARLAVPAGSIAVAAVASTVVTVWPPPGAVADYYYQPTIARVGTVVTATVLVLAAIAVVRQVRGRRANEWLWATALLGLPAGWLGPFDAGGLRVAASADVPHFGRLAQVVLASCVAGVTLAALARQPSARRRHAPLWTFSAVALGSTTGLAIFLIIGRAGWSGFAEHAAVPVHVPAAIAVLGLAGIAAVLAGPPPTGTVPWITPFGLATVGALVLAGIVTAYDNGWTLRGWADLGHAASLVVTLVMVPLAVGIDAAGRALSSRPSRRVGRTTALAVFVLMLGLGWATYSALPYALSWGPVPFVLVVCGVAAVVSRRRAPESTTSGGTPAST